jgi:hypothetical protein
MWGQERVEISTIGLKHDLVPLCDLVGERRFVEIQGFQTGQYLFDMELHMEATVLCSRCISLAFKVLTKTEIPF